MPHRTCAVLQLCLNAEDINVRIRKAESPILAGLIYGFESHVVASAYGMKPDAVLRAAYSQLQDIGVQHSVRLPELDAHQTRHPSVLMRTADRLCSVLTEREGHVVLFKDIFTAREWEEVVAILPLFEVFKRISNRLKEIENVDLQAHSGA